MRSKTGNGGMHGMWHLFVLAGSISHYVAILVYA